MSIEALVLTLVAAVMHATWNAIVKVVVDRAVVLALIALAHTVGGAVLIALAGIPEPASWPFLVESTLLHYGYHLARTHLGSGTSVSVRVDAEGDRINKKKRIDNQAVS